MEKISVEKTQDTENGWSFGVKVGESDDVTEHEVELEKAYWEKLTEGKTEPEELIKKSFQFLLERESKESILPKFNLKVINKYFPGYEQKIGGL